MYIDKVDAIVNKYNNTYHSTIKMKTANVKDNTNIYFDKKNNKEDPKLKNGDHIRISIYSELGWRSFHDCKFKITVPRTSVISDLNGKEIFGKFCEK